MHIKLVKNDFIGKSEFVRIILKQKKKQDFHLLFFLKYYINFFSTVTSFFAKFWADLRYALLITLYEVLDKEDCNEYCRN
jgi:hypothetical protein